MREPGDAMGGHVAARLGAPQGACNNPMAQFHQGSFEEGNSTMTAEGDTLEPNFAA